MNIALVGYGAMGKIVEEVVSEENKCFVVGKDFSSLFDIKEHIVKGILEERKNELRIAIGVQRQNEENNKEENAE